MDDIARLNAQIAALEVDVRHLRNELALTRAESEESTRNYFEIFSNMEGLVRERTAEIAQANEKLTREVAVRRTTEERLSESERKFRGIIDATPLGVHLYTLHESGRLILSGANPAADAILGFAHAPLLGSFVDEVLPGVSPEVAAPFLQVAVDGRPLHIEAEYSVSRSGTIFDVHAFQTAPRQMVVMFMDVTERKRTELELARHREQLEVLVKHRTQELDLANRELANTNRQFAAANQQLAAANQHLKVEIREREQAELALRESEERYRLFAENFQGIAFRTDLDWNPIFIHGEFPLLTGWEERDFTEGKIRWPELIHPGDRTRHMENTESLRRSSGSRTVQGEYRVLTRQREERWVLETVQVVCDTEGKPTYFQGAITDITDTKQAERAMRAAKELAETANELKSRFVFNVSHEIRTPLNGIIGFAEIIRESKAIETIHSQADVILRESDALLSLVNDLLDHAKIEAGKMDLDIRPLDLFGLLEGLMATAALQARNRGLEFGVTVAEGVPRHLRGDFLRLRQILLNLIANAIKFTHEGHVHLRVECLSADAQYALLRFEIEDTGIGIAPDKQGEIFQSFTQADASTTRKYGGTGLGTTIARQLVELMGGEIGLESSPGKGTLFWFNVPLAVCREDDDSDDLELGGDVVAFGERRAPRRGTILLAEDYRTNQELVRLHVEGAGHELTIVENGEQAVQLCAGRRFDLILMDLQMPVMDGQEATRRIRSSGGPCADVPILALTASAEASTSEACLRSGMDDVITKPIRQGSFLAALDRWLAGQPSRATGQFSAQPDSSEASVPRPDAAFTARLFDGLAPGNSRTAHAADAHAADTPDEEDAPLNLALVLEEFGNNQTLLDTVLNQFLVQLDTQRELLRDALAKVDLETLRREAHRIKGGAGNLTAMSLYAAARELEMFSASGTLEQAERLLDNLEREIERLRTYLSTHRSS